MTSKNKSKNLKKLMDRASQSTKVHPALKEYFGYCLHKSNIRYRTQLCKVFCQYGLIPPQFGILKLLNVVGPMSQIAIGEETDIDKATMVKLIDGLEKKNYIKRVGDAKDRRIKHIHLTLKGEAILEKALTETKKMEDQFLSPLKTHEKKLLLEIIPKLLESPIEIK